MPRYKVIVNPAAGRGEGGRNIPLIKTYLKMLKLDFDLVTTEAPWHAVELTQQAVAEGFDIVVAAGGDGTVNEVLNGLMLAKDAGLLAAMAVLPVGQGNDFAFSMGIPTELAPACEMLTIAKRLSIDVGRITGGQYPKGRFFGNGVGIGFDAVVGFEAFKLKRLHGFPAYLVAALKTIFLFFNAPNLKIELDEEAITQPCLLVSIMNGRRMGGGFMMAPESKPGDGVFDLCIGGQVSRLGILRLIVKFLNGTQGSHRAIQFKQASQVKVTALDGALPTHGDGETISTQSKELLIELLPAQIELITNLKE